MHQHIYKKQFGQNFLHDQNAIAAMIQEIAPKNTDYIVEIGPGLGAISKALAPLVQHLTLIEIDNDLITKLITIFNSYNNVTVIHQDILQLSLTSLLAYAPGAQAFRLVGNLPYNISSQILFHAIKYIPLIHDMYFMLQQEMAERILATPGNKAFGKISVIMQYHFLLKPSLKLNSHAFIPQPKVSSQLVFFIPHKVLPTVALDYNIFIKTVHLAFSMRRKTLYNNLKSVITKSALVNLNIDPAARAETLSVTEFVNISNFIFNNQATR